MKYKNVVFIIILISGLCFFTHSCTRFSLYSEKKTPLHYAVLQKISDTMTRYPVTAIEMLLKVSDTVDESKLDKSDYYEYQILVAEALYKNDFQQTNDSAVVEAVKYYDSLTEKYPNNSDILFQKSRAYYYKGVFKNEKNLENDAFVDFMGSLAAIDKINRRYRNNDVIYFKGLIYNRLARIFYYNTNDVAFELYQNANNCFAKVNTIWPLAINYKFMAKILTSEGKCAESERYLAKADSLINYFGTDYAVSAKNLSNDIAVTRALNMSEQGNHEEALRIVIDKRKELYGMVDILPYSHVLAELYYQNNILDSALYFYEEVFRTDSQLVSTIASRIIDICKVTGDNEKMAFYASVLAEENLHEQETTPFKSEMAVRYGQYEADKHKAEIREFWEIIIFVLVALMIIAAIITTIYLMQRKKHHRKEINDKDWYIGTLHGKIKKAKMENNDIKNKLKLAENEIYDLQKSKKHLSALFEDRMGCVMQDEFCAKISSMARIYVKTDQRYPELELSKIDQIHVTELFDRVFEGALLSLIKEHSRLKPSDKLLFCLCLLGLDAKHTAVFIGASYHTVYVRAKKCAEIICNEKDLHVALMTILA